LGFSFFYLEGVTWEAITWFFPLLPCPTLHWPMKDSLHSWTGDVDFPVSELKHFFLHMQMMFHKK